MSSFSYIYFAQKPEGIALEVAKIAAMLRTIEPKDHGIKRIVEV